MNKKPQYSGTTPSPTPVIPPITVTDNYGKKVTIVRKSNSITTDDDYVCVEDKEGKKYVLGLGGFNEALLESEALDNTWSDTEEDVDIIKVACVDEEVPNNNWLILKWLRDYYNFNFDHTPLYLIINGKLGNHEPSFSCEDNLLVIEGVSPSERTKFNFANNYELPEDEMGQLSCNGKLINEVNTYSVINTETLNSFGSNSEAYNAFKPLILLLNGRYVYLFPLVEAS